MKTVTAFLWTSAVVIAAFLLILLLLASLVLKAVGELGGAIYAFCSAILDAMNVEMCKRSVKQPSEPSRLPTSPMHVGAFGLEPIVPPSAEAEKPRS